MERRPLSPYVWAALVLSALLWALGHAPAVAADVVYVDIHHPYCGPDAAGTESEPFCSISTAVAARGGPGIVIRVRRGTYREEVVVPVSGSPGAPLVIQADGPGVFLEGADDISGADNWSAAGSGRYVARSVTWFPRQVFVDGVLLRRVTSLDSLAASCFTEVAGQGLFVNLGGGNPGTRRVLVGRRANAFRITDRSHVRIQGFDVRRYEDRGILVQGASTRDTIVNNFVSRSGREGIALIGAAECEVGSNSVYENADHGIELTSVVRSTIDWNDLHRNARPTQRAANGLHLFGSSNNRIIGNRLHRNQDSGQQLTAGSNDNLILYNRSWSNGDHGFDHLGSTGNVLLGCVAWGNYKDGFSFEGNSRSNRLYNSIASENGLNTHEYDLYVDSTSVAGFVSNSNVFWNATAQEPVKWQTVRYGRVADFAQITQCDTRTAQGDPRFANPAAGDFRLLDGSSAIDGADVTAPGWPTIDLVGGMRRDDSRTANRGFGPVTFADCGAFEHVPTPGGSSDDPPVKRNDANLVPGEDATTAAALSPTLSEGFPSPARAAVSFTLDLPQPGRVEWRVVDVMGRQVHEAVEDRPGGRSSWRWDAAQARAGCYFVQARTGANTFVRRVTVAR